MCTQKARDAVSPPLFLASTAAFLFTVELKTPTAEEGLFIAGKN